MKTWTIQFDLNQGCDEYWESNPTPTDVLKLFSEVLGTTSLYDNFNNKTLKIIKITDNTHYEYETEIEEIIPY
jgi:hypothetical protein